MVTVNGVSKAFAMTGWRLGYIGAPQWIADACTKMQGQITSGACGISQRAALAAVSADPSVTYAMRDAFKKRRDIVIEGLNNIKGVKTNVPEGAFYLFPDISSFFGKSDGIYKINDADDLTLYILNEALVALVSGRAFGNPNCIRFSYAASEKELKEALYRMKTVLDKLS